MIDIFHWQISQGRFFVLQHSGGNLPLNAELCAMKSVVVLQAMQLEIKYMKEMNVYTPASTKPPIGTEHLFIRARQVAQETKSTTKMDLTDTPMTFAASHLLKDFDFFSQGR